jgi:hypothetical protein
MTKGRQLQRGDVVTGIGTVLMLICFIHDGSRESVPKSLCEASFAAWRSDWVAGYLRLFAFLDAYRDAELVRYHASAIVPGSFVRHRK